MASNSSRKRLAANRRRIASGQLAAPRSTTLAETLAETLEREQAADGPQGAPPPELVAAYTDIYQFAAENPEIADQIQQMSELDVANLITGIAYAEELGFPLDECRHTARIIILWAVLTGVVYLYEWPEPVALLDEDQFIEHCRADRAAGQIPDPRSSR